MITNDELKYIQAYSKIIGVKEGDAIEYAEKKGLPALVENASQLLSTPKQREKHQAFLELYRMSSALATRNPVISSPEAACNFFHSVMENIHDKEAFVVAFLNTKNRVIDYEVVSIGGINVIDHLIIGGLNKDAHYSFKADNALESISPYQVKSTKRKTPVHER